MLKAIKLFIDRRRRKIAMDWAVKSCVDNAHNVEYFAARYLAYWQDGEGWP